MRRLGLFSGGGAAYSQRMSVLVGIPTHRRPDLLRQCLESIAAQAGELPPIRVFVADNDAKGRAGERLVAEMAAAYRFPLTGTVVAEPGISAVRNAILAEARRGGNEFIAMIDDDVRAQPDWLAILFARSAATGADVLAGPVSYEFPSETNDFIRRAFLSEIPPTGPIELINGTTGVLIATKLLQASDWPRFDAAFGLTGGGDKEWFSRLKKHGARFEWVAEAHIAETVPLSRANLKWLLKRRYRYGIDDIRIARMHGTRTSRIAMIRSALHLLALSPLHVRRLFTDRRYYWLGRYAQSLGRLSALFGIKFHEYASRH
jgi:glycosyltransferase involved in cell wall biosynthesis